VKAVCRRSRGEVEGPDDRFLRTEPVQVGQDAAPYLVVEDAAHHRTFLAVVERKHLAAECAVAPVLHHMLALDVVVLRVHPAVEKVHAAVLVPGHHPALEETLPRSAPALDLLPHASLLVKGKDGARAVYRKQEAVVAVGDDVIGKLERFPRDEGILREQVAPGKERDAEKDAEPRQEGQKDHGTFHAHNSRRKNKGPWKDEREDPG